MCVCVCPQFITSLDQFQHRGHQQQTQEPAAVCLFSFIWLDSCFFGRRGKGPRVSSSPGVLRRKPSRSPHLTIRALSHANSTNDNATASWLKGQNETSFGVQIQGLTDDRPALFRAKAGHVVWYDRAPSPLPELAVSFFFLLLLLEVPRPLWSWRRGSQPRAAPRPPPADRCSRLLLPPPF